eukprot:300571-Chlamydomonas_euryale.AAC.8
MKRVDATARQCLRDDRGGLQRSCARGRPRGVDASTQVPARNPRRQTDGFPLPGKVAREAGAHAAPPHRRPRRRSRPPRTAFPRVRAEYTEGMRAFADNCRRSPGMLRHGAPTHTACANCRPYLRLRCTCAQQAPALKFGGLPARRRGCCCQSTAVSALTHLQNLHGRGKESVRSTGMSAALASCSHARKYDSSWASSAFVGSAAAAAAADCPSDSAAGDAFTAENAARCGASGVPAQATVGSVSGQPNPAAGCQASGGHDPGAAPAAAAAVACAPADSITVVFCPVTARAPAAAGDTGELSPGALEVARRRACTGATCAAMGKSTAAIGLAGAAHREAAAAVGLPGKV